MKSLHILRVSLDILDSLVSYSIGAVFSQTQISRTKQLNYAEPPLHPPRSTLSRVLNFEVRLSQVCFSLINQQQS